MSLILKNVTNQDHDNEVQVDQGGNLVWLGDDGVLQDGAVLTSGASISACIEVDTGGGPVQAVAFSGDYPVSVEVDWSVVNSVDQYYNSNNQSQTDIGITDSGVLETITIVG